MGCGRICGTIRAIFKSVRSWAKTHSKYLKSCDLYVEPKYTRLIFCYIGNLDHVDVSFESSHSVGAAHKTRKQGIIFRILSRK